jgi:hypothetical protein
MKDEMLLLLRRLLFLEGLEKGLDARALHVHIDDGIRSARAVRQPVRRKRRMRAAG